MVPIFISIRVQVFHRIRVETCYFLIVHETDSGDGLKKHGESRFSSEKRWMLSLKIQKEGLFLYQLKNPKLNSIGISGILNSKMILKRTNWRIFISDFRTY
jgi:hypothetical protein